jgi:chloride channel 7
MPSTHVILLVHLSRHCHRTHPQDDAIRALFSSRTKREYTVAALVVFVASFYGLAVITYGVFCPTGLFVPSILCGAAYGRLVCVWLVRGC